MLLLVGLWRAGSVSCYSLWGDAGCSPSAALHLNPLRQPDLVLSPRCALSQLGQFSKPDLLPPVDESRLRLPKGVLCPCVCPGQSFWVLGNLSLTTELLVGWRRVETRPLILGQP